MRPQGSVESATPHGCSALLAQKALLWSDKPTTRPLGRQPIQSGEEKRVTAFNVVRMRVKPGREKEFLDLNRQLDKDSAARMKKNGFRKFSIVKTGDRSYCFIGEWETMDSIVKSRPEMIADLDKMRGLLEDLGSGLGVTDPVSGEMVIELKP
jgi:hypothetical protein